MVGNTKDEPSEAKGKAILYRSRRSTPVRAEATAGVTCVSAVTHNADTGVLNASQEIDSTCNVVEIYFMVSDAMLEPEFSLKFLSRFW